MDWKDAKKHAIGKLDRILREHPELSNGDMYGNSLLRDYIIDLWFFEVSDLMEYDRIPAGSTMQLMDALSAKGYRVAGKQGSDMIFLVNGEEFLVGENNRIRPKFVGDNYTGFPFIYAGTNEIIRRMEEWPSLRCDAEEIVEKAISKRRRLDVVREIQFSSMAATVEGFNAPDLNLRLVQEGCSIFLHFGWRETPNEWFTARVSMKSLGGLLAKAREILSAAEPSAASREYKVNHFKTPNGSYLPWK